MFPLSVCWLVGADEKDFEERAAALMSNSNNSEWGLLLFRLGFLGKESRMTFAPDSDTNDPFIGPDSFHLFVFTGKMFLGLVFRLMGFFAGAFSHLMCCNIHLLLFEKSFYPQKEPDSCVPQTSDG